MSERREREAATAGHIFPVCEEAKRRTIEFIIINDDPEDRRIDLLADCVVHDDVLATAMERLVGGWDIPEEYEACFIEGFAFTQKAFKIQASESRVRLPRMNANVMHAYFEQLALFKGSVEDWFGEYGEAIQNEDEIFCNLVDDYLRRSEEMTPAQKFSFMFGCFTSYDFFKYQIKALDFEAAFSKMF